MACVIGLGTNLLCFKKQLKLNCLQGMKNGEVFQLCEYIYLLLLIVQTEMQIGAPGDPACPPNVEPAL